MIDPEFDDPKHKAMAVELNMDVACVGARTVKLEVDKRDPNSISFVIGENRVYLATFEKNSIPRMSKDFCFYQHRSGMRVIYDMKDDVYYLMEKDTRD